MLQVDPREKTKLIDPLFQISWRFWLSVGGLSILVIAGVIAYGWQVIAGLGETGMQRPVYWGMYMVNFVFFIGVSLAGTLISAILRITGAEWRRPITRIAEAITAFALVIASIQIVVDMGRPDRLHYTIIYGRWQSPILWDVTVVAVYLIGSAFYLYLPLIPDAAAIRDNLPNGTPTWRRLLYRVLALGWRGNVEQWRRLEKAVSMMALFIIPIAVSVHTVTSWLLATTVQPGWHSTVFGPYFVVTAIFSGISALFIVMTLAREILRLQDYITLKQYRDLSYLFITMAIIWGYFTYTETLTLVAGQQMMEFPVLASKLWGRFAISFWLMLGLIFMAFVIMVLSKITPRAADKIALLRPPYTMGIALIGMAAFVALYDPQLADTMDAPGLRPTLWTIATFSLIGSILGVGLWCKKHPIATAVIAGSAVLTGTWLERWNIIVPTLTHPRLIYYSFYTPTLIEIIISIASVALLVLMTIVFFKLFPAVSIWEVAEGRVIDAAHDKLEIPVPQPNRPAKKQRWKFR